MNADTVKIEVDDLTFIYTLAPCCSVGDYSGDGSVGEANIRWIKENLLCETLHPRYSFENGAEELSAALDLKKPLQAFIGEGAYSSKWVYLLSEITSEDKEFDPDEDCDGFTEVREIFDALHDYPVLDDGLLSEVEEEWKTEAWNDWLAGDLARAVDKMLPDELRDRFEELSGDEAKEMFYEAHYEKGIGEFIPECSGMGFSGLESVAEYIVDKLEAELAENKVKASINGWAVSEAVEGNAYCYYLKGDDSCQIGMFPGEWQSWEAAAQDRTIVDAQITLPLE